MAEGSLSDLRIVDLTQGIAGPYCTKLFADLGAEVIKVESPDGDWTRAVGPFPSGEPHPEKSGLFLHLNTGKKSVTLDVDSDAGLALVIQLLAEADVLVESDGQTRMAALGLAHDDLKSDLPNLISVSVTPFGCSGPYKDYRGNSLTAMAMSTIMYNTGEPNREPLTTGGTPGDYIAGIHAWIGALAAIAHRAEHGKGQHVDVSLAEAAACADEYNAGMYAFQGAIRRRFYSRHVFGYPMDIMACKDGYVVVVPGAGGFPQRGLTQEGAVSPMSLLMEDPELDQNPLFQSGQARMISWKEVDELIQPFLNQKTSEEIVEFAQALRMPFAPVPTVKDLVEDEHLAARNFFETVDHPEAGKVTHAGPPFRMTETPPAIAPAPALGEHNKEFGASDA